MSDTVLILDADQRSALAATRSLGARGLRVVVADEGARTLAGCSRHAAASARYPSPYEAPDRFIEAVADLCRRHQARALFPMTDITTGLVLRHRERFAATALPCPDFAAYEAVTDKFRLFAEAERQGLPMPRTWFIDPAADDPAAIAAHLPYPIVMKPARSRWFAQGRWHMSSVRIARDRDELLTLRERHACFRTQRFLLQRFVAGEGQGLFVLYDRGRPLQRFAHRRLREKPPSGGVSVLSESIPVNEALCDTADRLLAPLGWTGVAMVEFKVAPDGTPNLMEINGRFWGSLQLAIDAGVDFPWLAWQLAAGNPPTPAPFEPGVRSRWLLGDLDHLYLELRGRGRGRGALAAVGDFLLPSRRRTRHEVNRLDDLRPFLFELGRYLRRSP